jgi:hypothetical protein
MTSKAPRPDGLDRRSFLGRLGVGAASIAGLAASATAATSKADPQLPGKDIGALLDTPEARTARAFEIRMRAAELARDRAIVAQTPNGEEQLYPNRIANYSKGLPHNAFGEVDPGAYDSFLGALRSGDPARFEALPMGLGRKLTNPLAGMAFDLEGPDGHHLAIPPAPTIASAEGGSELGEVYWMALARDVHFSDYGSSPIIADAAADLSRFPDFRGPKAAGGQVTPETIFRGSTPGDLVGPYLSQFMWLGFHMGALTVAQRVWTLPAGTEYLTQYGDWLASQNGFQDYSYPIDSTPRYIRNLRDLAQWVHVDALYQAYHQACLILLDIGAPFAAGVPYTGSATQIGFGTFGGPHILSLVTEVASRALKAVWYQKWFVHRRLRPEAFAGLVHQARTGRNYPVSRDVLNSAVLDRLYSRNGTYLLPTIAPEGAPTHPSYGAGHATVAGACVTILKAWFDGSHELPRTVVPDASGTALLAYAGPALSVENELNKLAANVAIGRNGAGIHYRADYWESVKLGEKIAVGILEEQRETYREICNFSFRGFEGQTITI